MELHIKIIGFCLMVLAAVHVVFPRYFKWQEELRHLSLINRQMMQTHTFFIALTVALMGCLCIEAADLLVQDGLGRMICLGMAVFWSLRWFFQLFVYSTQLWKGKKLETAIHILFTLFWTYTAVVWWRAFFGI